MEEKKINPILTPLTKTFSEKSLELDRLRNVSFMHSCWEQGLTNLQMFWAAVDKKPKKLLVACSKGIVGLITLNEKSFHLMLNEDGLKDLTGEKFEFQEIQ